MAKTTVSMKLLIDTAKGNKRVLFAEAGKDCVDFLFQILSLPIATVIRLLQVQGMEGSLPTLYKSLENLDNTYIQPNTTKTTFLQPVSPVATTSVPLLAINSHVSTAKNFYSCPNSNRSKYHDDCYNYNNNNNNKNNNCFGYVSDDPLAVCPQCNIMMTRELTYVIPPYVKVAASTCGLVKGIVTYMVMDDLEVKPMSSISSLTLLNKFTVKDISTLEEKVVNVGMNEALKLLKASLDSKTVLTNVFC